MRAPVVAGLAAALALGATACGEAEPEPSASPTFTVPSGVTLTEAGSTIEVGKVASVVVSLGAARSAVDLTVRRVRKGSVQDLRTFGLAADQRASTPYYVTVAVRNRGPAGLGGSTVPVVVRTRDDQRIASSEVNGAFSRCPTSTLPDRFLPGAEARLCLVFLVPKGQRLASVDLQPGSPGDAVRVRP